MIDQTNKIKSRSLLSNTYTKPKPHLTAYKWTKQASKLTFYCFFLLYFHFEVVPLGHKDQKYSFIGSKSVKKRKVTGKIFKNSEHICCVVWPFCWSPVHILLSPVQFRLLKDNELSVAVNVYSSRHHPFKTKSAISLITLPSKTKSVLSTVCQYAVICICSYLCFRLSGYWYVKSGMIYWQKLNVLAIYMFVQVNH